MSKKFNVRLTNTSVEYKTVVEIEDGETIYAVYQHNDTSYIIRDIYGNLFIVPRISSSIYIEPFVNEK